MKFTNEQYDKLKYISRYVLPAVGTLYFTLSGIWKLPNGEQVLGTITAITIALNTILGISHSKYDDGTPAVVGDLEVVKEADDVSTLQVILDKEDLDSITSEQKVTLRVQSKDSSQL